MHSLQDMRLRGDRKFVATAMVLLLVPTLWYLRTDLALYGTDDRLFWGRVMVRTLLVGTALAGLVAMRRHQSRDRYSRTTALLAWAVVLAILALNLMRPAGSGMPLRAPLFILALLYAVMPNGLVRQILPPLALTVGLSALRLTRLAEGPGVDIPGDIVILLSINALGVLITHQRITLEEELARAWDAESQVRRKADAAVSELKTLRGIIPICSYCKRIRSEHGDWQQVERYVKENSEAEFSHGICPSCFDTHSSEG